MFFVQFHYTFFWSVLSFFVLIQLTNSLRQRKLTLFPRICLVLFAVENIVFIIVSVNKVDAELYSKDINEGDWVYFDLNNRIFKEQ